MDDKTVIYEADDLGPAPDDSLAQVAEKGGA